jgi:hypothetical protein
MSKRRLGSVGAAVCRWAGTLGDVAGAGGGLLAGTLGRSVGPTLGGDAVGSLGLVMPGVADWNMTANCCRAWR